MIEFLAVVSILGQDATTTCSTMFGTTTCNTQQQRGPMDSFFRGMETGRRAAPAAREPRPLSACAGGDWWLAGCTRGEHDEAVRQRDTAAKTAGARAAALAKLREGDCAGAVIAALEAEDLALATEVRQFCAVSPPTANSTPPAQ